MAEYKIPLVAVVGPTASGKTQLGIDICKQLGGEVISCDSMQIYKGMDIATAKPTAEEMQGVRHHLIDFAPADRLFSVAAYCDMARDTIKRIHSAGRLPVLVGGTGLYYSSLVDNIEFIDEKTDFEYREHLKSRAEREGSGVLLDELEAVDPQAASALHINNTGRIIRALEIYHTTGKTKTEQEKLSRLSPSPYRLTAIGLDAHNRAVLYDRIDARVDNMLSLGLLKEAESFYSGNPSGTAVQAIGYKELKPYLDGKEPLDECVERLKAQTRHYAKRQLTWFRRDERIHFLYIDDYESARQLASKALEIVSEGSE